MFAKSSDTLGNAIWTVTFPKSNKDLDRAAEVTLSSDSKQ